MATDTINSSTSLPAWVQPYAAGYLQQSQNVADQPYQAYQGEQVAGFNPWQTNALTAQANRATQGSATMGSANTALQGIFNASQPQTPGNPYMGAGNPYLTQQIDYAQQDLARNWNSVQKPAWDSAMSNSGSFGNAGVAEANQRAASDTQYNMGRIGSDMRMQDYGAQQNRLMQALQMAPSFAANDYADIDRLRDAGSAYQALDQRGLDNSYRNFLESRDYNKNQLELMGNALRTSYGQTTTGTQPGTSPAAQALGGGLAGLSLYDMLFKK